MKFGLQATAALVLLSGCAAFTTPTRTMHKTAVAVQMFSNENESNNNDLGKAAMTFLTAATLAVSTATTILPPQPVAAAADVAVTVDLKKLPAEERNLIIAKDNSEIAGKTLKENTKKASDSKATVSKVSSDYAAQQKAVASAKKRLIADSDKLSRAKNDNMPSSAIKELSTVSATSKNAFKTQESKLSGLSKTLSTAEGNAKKAESSVKSSTKEIKTTAKKTKGAEKALSKYKVKVQKQQKKDAEAAKKAKQAAQNAKKVQQKRVSSLEDQAKKLKSDQEKIAKEVANKQKTIEAEQKNLAKMKIP